MDFSEDYVHCLYYILFHQKNTGLNHENFGGIYQVQRTNLC